MKNSLVEFAIMFFIGALSLGLLAYVGNREAYTKYPQFEIEKVTSQAEPVRLILEKFLSAGLPLSQFAGFDTLVNPIVKVEDAIDAITVVNRSGIVVFQLITPGEAIDPIDFAAGIPRQITTIPGKTQTQIVVPLRSRFEFGGRMIIHLPNRYVNKKIEDACWFLPWAAAIGVLAMSIYGALVVNFAPVKRAQYDRIVFAVVFLSVAGTAIAGLINLYAVGSQTKAEGFGLAITERIRAIYDLGLRLDDLDGVEATLKSYDDLNPEIENIALTINNLVVISTNSEAVGKPIKSDPFAFNVVNRIEGIAGLDAQVHLSMPFEVVLLAVGRTAKTFIVLLVACGFMAGLFFQLGGALRRLRAARRTNATDGQSAVDAIKPVLFIGFLVENLAASFLPQLMQQSATAGGLSPSLASLMFMTYFVTFALTLVPAGVYAGDRGARPLLLLGAAIAAIAALIMAFSDNYLAVVAARALSGIGQGMLFIGSQSYILAYAAADKRTQSAGIIVYTFNGGMLSGLVIGGLLSGYIGNAGVFWIAVGFSIAILLYTLALIDTSPPAPRSREPALGSSRGSILSVFRSPGFMLTTLLVGIPAKAVLTGVIFFAMPLLLSAQKLAQEDIGQIIMFYALGVLVSSHFVSRYADRRGHVRGILFVGLVLSGIGLALIGAIGWSPIIALDLGPIALTVILLAGTLTVGIGHGCINAPVVTQIAASDVSQRLGEAEVTAFYRFIERVGHAAGPIVVGQLFFLSNQSPTAIAWLGGAMVVFAVAFIGFRPAAGSRQTA